MIQLSRTALDDLRDHASPSSHSIDPGREPAPDPRDVFSNSEIHASDESFQFADWLIWVLREV